MGQSQSTQPDDTSCFRACLREKNNKNRKQPAAPLPPPNPQLLDIPKEPQIDDKSKKEYCSTKKINSPTRAGETSIEDRLQAQKMTGFGEVNGTTKVAVYKESSYKPQSPEQEGGILGLQSKFSTSRKTTIKKHQNFTKITTASEGVCRSNCQNEGGLSEEANKSQGTSTESTKSRNVLLHKIEQIKQKYYQRQLVIEIYQNQNEYEQNIGTKEEERGSSSRLKSKEGTGNVRQKILDKLNKRKHQKKKQKEKQTSHILPPEELQLYSKDRIQPQLEESARSVKNRVQDVNTSTKQQDLSLEDRMSFSGYSQQDTLHQIRQCDQQEEDYRSKMDSKAKSSRINRSKPLQFRLNNQNTSHNKNILVHSKEDLKQHNPGGSKVGQSQEQMEGKATKILLF